MLRAVSPFRKAFFLTACLLVVALVIAFGVGPEGAKAANPPVIQNMFPTQGQVGSIVIITGGNFQTVGIVTFNNVIALPITWTTTTIVTRVPQGVTTGPVKVTTVNGGSNEVTFTVTATPPLGAPQITAVVPNTGPAGTPVVITGTDFQTAGIVTFNNVVAAPVAWSNTLIVTTVPQGATTGPVVVTTVLGSSNGVTFTVTGPLTPAQTWYLAEGSTAYGFDTYVLMANPNAAAATVTVVYNTSLGRIPRPLPVTVPADSRVTLHVSDDVPNVDVSTTLRASVPIVAERAVYWNDRIEGTDSIGVTAGSKTWYLAEGSTAHGFETWVLIQNPGTAAANVNVTYMTSKGIVKKPAFPVAAGQRYTIDVGRDVGFCDVSTKVESDQDIICERSMYWDARRGGHDSIGVTSPGKTWYLAEGSTAWGFTTWLLLQNPAEDKSAKVNVTYMTKFGPVYEPDFTMGPGSRKTIRVNDSIADEDTSIMVDSDNEVIAERAMYWDNGTGKAGHDTVGVPAPATNVYLGEGSTAWGFETFLSVQNPSSQDAVVSVTYMTPNGPVNTPNRVVGANSRLTVDVNEECPNVDASIKVQSATPIMAERAMYWHDKGGGHVSIGWNQ